MRKVPSRNTKEEYKLCAMPIFSLSPSIALYLMCFKRCLVCKHIQELILTIKGAYITTLEIQFWEGSTLHN